MIRSEECSSRKVVSAASIHRTYTKIKLHQKDSLTLTSKISQKQKEGDTGKCMYKNLALQMQTHKMT